MCLGELRKEHSRQTLPSPLGSPGGGEGCQGHTLPWELPQLPCNTAQPLPLIQTQAE